MNSTSITFNFKEGNIFFKDNIKLGTWYFLSFGQELSKYEGLFQCKDCT